jgi:hypothetical protein
VKRLARAALTTTLTVLAARIAGGEPSGAGLPCREGSLQATLTLDYDQRTLGDVTGLFLEVGYPDGAGLPGKGTDPSVRERLTSLLDPKFRVLAVDEDADGDGREKHVRILVTTNDRAGLPAGPIARLRFNCAGLKPPVASGFTCRTDQVADNAAQLLTPKLASQVTCATTFPGKPPASQTR